MELNMRIREELYKLNTSELVELIMNNVSINKLIEITDKNTRDYKIALIRHNFATYTDEELKARLTKNELMDCYRTIYGETCRANKDKQYVIDTIRRFLRQVDRTVAVLQLGR